MAFGSVCTRQAVKTYGGHGMAQQCRWMHEFECIGINSADDANSLTMLL